ncbi:MAG TPA: MarR family transcriptional regulator [Acidimicrobiia bacterium]|nr:MarR family transcriptional regulator [Acidimicrobiia bacterium]
MRDDLLDDDRLTAIGLFFETAAGLEAALGRHLDGYGLPRVWLEVLVRIARSPGHQLRMADLAAQVALSPSGLTRAVDKIEEAGLVARVSCPSDRRGAFVQLTEAGRERLDAIIPDHLTHLEESFTGLLSPAELARFTATLRKLRDHLNPGAAQLSPGYPAGC